MSYKLFIDDQRMPKDAYIYPRRCELGIIIKSQNLKNFSGIDDDDWVIVRNYKDFVSIIENEGLPDVVSFDHDLSEEYIKHYYAVTKQIGIIEYGNLKPDSGYHCAKYLVQEWKKKNKPKYIKTFIHSANQYGQANIKEVLKELYL
jgi:hypothetical protein